MMIKMMMKTTTREDRTCDECDDDDCIDDTYTRMMIMMVTYLTDGARYTRCLLLQYVCTVTLFVVLFFGDLWKETQERGKGGKGEVCVNQQQVKRMTKVKKECWTEEQDRDARAR